MIVVDDAGGAVPVINHSPWNGLTMADYVMPFFLFIVGLSLSLAYKVRLLLIIHPIITSHTYAWWSISESAAQRRCH